LRLENSDLVNSDPAGPTQIAAATIIIIAMRLPHGIVPAGI